MIRSLVSSMVRVACFSVFALLLAPAWPAADVAGGEPRYGDRLRPEDLRAWQQRLAKFDDAAPKADLLHADRLTAYEENQHFAYAYGETTSKDATATSIRFRRVLLLKPDTLIVDDLWSGGESCRTIQRIGWTAEPVAVTPDGFVPQEILDMAKWLDTADPVGDLTQTSAGGAGSTDESPDGAFRCLSVFQMGASDSTQRPAAFSLKPEQNHLHLTIRTGDRQFVVELPRRYVEPGWIAASSSDGTTSGDTTLIARRPLPAGVLPHGEQGIGLIERWDRAYRGNGRPGWDTGVVAEDLRNAVEQGHVQPCRTVVLGCGSGTNSIYLASKGFEVTAIDVAPTALSIADAKAQKAGVRVRWLLADVLNLPDLGTFDLIFDRGCYHNVRYVDAAGFVESVCQLSHPSTKALILSLNRDSAPGVREKTMRDDFSSSFDFVWLKESEIRTGANGESRRASWSLLLQKKGQQ